MLIDVALLQRVGAYDDQREAFVKAFPDGLVIAGEPDPKVIRRLVDSEFEIEWLCAMVLQHHAVDVLFARTRPFFAEYENTASSLPDPRDGSEESAWDAYLVAQATTAWCILSDPNNIRDEHRP